MAEDNPSTSTDASSNEQALIELLKKSPKGVMDADIQIGLPDLSTQDRVKLVNALLAKGLLDLFNQGGNLVYKYKEKTAVQVKGADNEEKVILRIIEEAGNKGIWMRDIRYQSNLLATQLNKILKALENKKLIKAVKSVSVNFQHFLINSGLFYLSSFRQVRRKSTCCSTWNRINH